MKSIPVTSSMYLYVMDTIIAWVIFNQLRLTIPLCKNPPDIYTSLPVWNASNQVPKIGAMVCPGLDTKAVMPNMSAETACVRLWRT